MIGYFEEAEGQKSITRLNKLYKTIEIKTIDIITKIFAHFLSLKENIADVKANKPNIMSAKKENNS